MCNARELCISHFDRSRGSQQLTIHRNMTSKAPVAMDEEYIILRDEFRVSQIFSTAPCLSKRPPAAHADMHSSSSASALALGFLNHARKSGMQVACMSSAHFAISQRPLPSLVPARAGASHVLLQYPTLRYGFFLFCAACSFSPAVSKCDIPRQTAKTDVRHTTTWRLP